MKAVVTPLLAAVILAACCSILSAQSGYMGLFADEAHSNISVISPGGFMPFEMWVWCLPGADGQICAEFSIQYPAIVIPSIVTWNEPMIAVSLGDLPGGLGVCYKECQHEWNWICHQTCYLTSTDPAEIKIAAHPEAGVYQFANCSPGYPIEPVHLLTYLILNYSSG